MDPVLAAEQLSYNNIDVTDSSVMQLMLLDQVVKHNFLQKSSLVSYRNVYTDIYTLQCQQTDHVVSSLSVNV